MIRKGIFRKYGLNFLGFRADASEISNCCLAVVLLRFCLSVFGISDAACRRANSFAKISDVV